MQAARIGVERPKPTSAKVLWLGERGQLPVRLSALLSRHGYALVSEGDEDRPPLRLACLDARAAAERNPRRLLTARRIAVVHGDPGIADGMAQAVRALGATAAVVGTHSQGLARIAMLQPEVLLADPNEIDGEGFETLAAVWGHAQLRWTPVLLTPQACFDGSGSVEFDRMVARIAELATPFDRFVRAALAESCLEVPLSDLGPVQLLRGLVESGGSYSAQFETPDIDINVDVAHGIVVGAQRQGDREDVLGARALAILSRQERGQVLVVHSERPAVTNIMAPIETALSAAFVERSSWQSPATEAANDAAAVQVPKAPVAPAATTRGVGPLNAKSATSSSVKKQKAVAQTPKVEKPATAKKSKPVQKAKAAAPKAQAPSTPPEELYDEDEVTEISPLLMAAPASTQAEPAPVEPAPAKPTPAGPAKAAPVPAKPVAVEPPVSRRPARMSKRPVATLLGMPAAQRPPDTPPETEPEPQTKAPVPAAANAEIKVEQAPAGPPVSRSLPPVGLPPLSLGSLPPIGGARPVAARKLAMADTMIAGDAATLFAPDAAAANVAPEAAPALAEATPPALPVAPPPLAAANAPAQDSSVPVDLNEAAVEVPEARAEATEVVPVPGSDVAPGFDWRATLQHLRAQLLQGLQSARAGVASWLERGQLGTQLRAAWEWWRGSRVAWAATFALVALIALVWMWPFGGPADSTAEAATPETAGAAEPAASDDAQPAEPMAASASPAEPDDPEVAEAPSDMPEGAEAEGTLALREEESVEPTEQYPTAADSNVVDEEAEPDDVLDEQADEDEEALALEDEEAEDDQADERSGAKPPSRYRRASNLVAVGNQALKRKHYPAAVKHFENALRLIPRYPRALEGLTQAHLSARHGKAALATAKRLVGISPKRARHHRLLGDAYAATMNIPKAQQAWQRAASRGDRVAKKRLGQ